MPEALKSFFSPKLIDQLAADIVRVHKKFPEKNFVKAATHGLAALELLERGRHIAQALGEHLPKPYPEALKILLRSLGPEHASEELLGVGMAPFYYLPHVIFVAERGLSHFDLSMHAQYELTKRFSAEFSIRPYIAQDPERTFKFLRKWSSDPNPHVRRLVSEGTRLRLPWATRVAWLDANPERVLELLELLKDDPASVVRRSVANNLNDLGKVQPKLLMKTCAQWLKDAPKASSERKVLVEHALRSAVKRGEPEALRILGFGQTAKVAIEDVRFTPKRVDIGGRVAVQFVLCSKARTTQNLLVDIAVHFVKSGGKTVPKVFKLKRVDLLPQAKLSLQSKISLAVHSTRKPRPGTHTVDVLINGAAVRLGAFAVVDTHE